MTKKTFFASASVFIISLLVYLKTLCPTVCVGDSGMLVTVASTLGIAHPPGYPMYIVTGKVFSLIPFGSVAWRLNFMSAFFGALTVAMMCIVVSRLSGDVIIAFCTALLAAFSLAFWSQSIAARTYTLNAFFMVTAMIILMVYRERKEERFLYLFAFVYGLSLTHHYMMITFAPAFIYFAYEIIREHGMPLKKCLAKTTVINLSVLLLIALFFYVYMPIRSAANPPVDWGDTETLSGFMRHLTRSQYKTMESGSAQGIITKFLFTKSFLSSLTGQVTIFVAWIGIFGLWWLYRRDRKLFIFTALIFLINSLGLIAVFQFDYIPLKIFKLEVYYFLPAYLIYIVWIGCGLAYFAQKIAKAGMLRKACTLLAVFLPLIPLVSNYRMNDWSDNYIAYDYGQNILKSMEKDSVIFGLGDTPLFVLWYLYFVEHERQDITIVHLFPSRAECEALEGRNPSIVSARNLYGAKFMRDVVETNYGRVPLYIHLYDATWLRDTGYTLLLEGLVFRIVKSDAPEMSMEPLKAHWNLWRNYTYANTHRTSLYKGYVNYMVREIIQVYAGSYHSLGGIYLASYMDLEKAKAEFEKALEFAPDFADASLWLGKTYYLMQDYPSALLYLRRYLSLKEWKDEKQKEQFENKIRLVTLQEEGKLSPEKVIFSASDESLIDRAVACFQEGKYDEALSRFEEILKSNPEEAWRVYNNIGLIYYKEGKYERALVSYGKAIELNPDYDSAYYNRGLLYQRLKKFKEAIADYEKAIGINRTYFNAYVKSGDVYRELGENEKALRNWKKAEQIDPQNDSLKQKIYGLKSMK